MILFSFVIKADARSPLNLSHLKMRTNKLNFKGEVTKVRFRITDFCIPNVQPFDSRSLGEDHGKTIWVTAGRHGTHSTATCFNKLIKNDASHTTFNHLPKTLHFAIKGTLTLTDYDGTAYKFQNIVLAQGRHGAANNWWFGGEGCHSIQDLNAVSCRSHNKNAGEWCFARGGIFMKPNTVRVTPEKCDAYD